MAKTTNENTENNSKAKLDALEAARAQIDKQFGKGSLMKLGDSREKLDIEVIPSGSLLLDEALGVGGYPKGRIIEIYGPESSGKTTLALHAIAEAQKLPSAKRKDSQGICFLGKINYNDFIERYLGKRPGKIIELETGKVLGKHNGYWFHTIGQRKGLGLSGGPWFVIKKDIHRNIIYVSNGYDPETQYGRIVNLHGFDFITEDPWGEFDDRKEITFKIRHTPEFTHGYIRRIGDLYRIESDDKIQGIAPGQYAVVYDKEHHLCMGSGMIIGEEE